jgi:LacI family transcriptional regulator
MKKSSITLSDIARKLNVSTVTISKALRNHPDISDETRSLVVETAEKMGYTPNFMARNLSSRRTNTIGVVIPKIAHFFFGSIIETIYDLAFQNNYEIILTVSQESSEREKKHIQTLLSMKVDGIIISISQETTDYAVFKNIVSREIPIVFIDRIPDLDNVNKVFVDDKGGAFKAVEQAIKIGYTKIGHFAGYDAVNIGKQRYLGFEEAMKHYGVPINNSWVVKGGFGEKFGYESFMNLHSAKNLPEVIFTVTYPVALGIYKAAYEVGLKIPHDIDVICFGDANEQKYLSPPLSCVDQAPSMVAENAMNIILEDINSKTSIPCRSVQIPTKLLLRETCIRKYHNEKIKSGV